jgi:transcription antitermination factor NusA-like protein
MATKTLDISLIRYLNLFEKITQVRTDSCFTFNNIMFFAVPKNLIYKAVGEKGMNIKKLSEILGKRIKVIGMPDQTNPQDINKFILDMVNPIQPKGIEITDNEIIITAGNKISKASLIGRDKQKLNDLEKIAKDWFGKALKII